MQDSTYAFFLGFAGLWILLGIAGLVLLYKNEKQERAINTQVLLVGLPIVIPFLLALIFGAIALP